jgi:hypothetical protein
MMKAKRCVVLMSVLAVSVGGVAWAQELSKTWQQTVSKDEMTDVTSSFMSLESEESEAVGLVLNKIEGKVFLTVLSTRSRFDCDFKGAWSTTLLVRIDEGKAFKVSAACNKKDHGMVWPDITNPSSILGKIQKGQVMKIRAEHVLSGSETYTFHIADLDMSKVQ